MPNDPKDVIEFTIGDPWTGRSPTRNDGRSTLRHRMRRLFLSCLFLSSGVAIRSRREDPPATGEYTAFSPKSLFDRRSLLLDIDQRTHFVEDDVGAGACEDTRIREIDAARRAGHDGGLPFRIPITFFLISDEVTLRFYSSSPRCCWTGVVDRGRPSCNQSSLVAPERASDRLLQIVVNDPAEA